MATLARIEVPDQLLAAIERRAKAHGVTLEQQVIDDLALVEKSESERPNDALLADIRSARDEMARAGIFITNQMIDTAKREGRP